MDTCKECGQAFTKRKPWMAFCSEDCRTAKKVPMEWVGPPGHRHRTLGDLVPGQVYEVPADDEKALAAQRAFWRRPQKVKEKASRKVKG